MTALARLDKLDNAIAADEVLRGAWRTERDGRDVGQSGGFLGLFLQHSAVTV